jgi:signal transduction histidine kinase/CheY-like chemotaxis protein
VILGWQYAHLRRMFRPLKDLIQFTRHVGQGDLTQKATIQRRDEVGELAVAFNQMVSELHLSREHMQSLLAEAQQASRLKSEFLANMSHEIRTPMNGIVGMTGLALATPLNAEQREYIGLVKSSAESLLALVNDILDFSHIEAGGVRLNVERFAVPAHLHQTVQMLSLAARQKGFSVDCEVAPETPQTVMGDPIRLRQVLMNLLGNAIKFTSAGKVSVRVELAAGSPAGIHLHYSVTDTGIGIAPDQQRIIFDAFRQVDGSSTRRYGGTGLGLAIASDLVALMGGRIWVESEVGCGSTFHFTAQFAPAQAGEEPAQGGMRPVAGQDGRKLRVLLAEDNPVNQKLAVRLLEKRGHAVVVAGNGCEALAALDGQPFDVVLMDVQMPEMDGLEAAERIRQREQSTGTRVPIVAMTAHAMKADRQRCLDAGMDDYLTKPVKPQDLYAAIERAYPFERAPN